MAPPGPPGRYREDLAIWSPLLRWPSSEGWGSRGQGGAAPLPEIGTPGGGMRLAIVGSQGRYAAPWHLEIAVRLIERVLDEYRPGLLISGGGPGVERMAAVRARGRGILVVEHRPQDRGWPGPRECGLRIARDCDRLVRILLPDGAPLDSGWTMDRARELGKPVEEYVVGRPATYLKRVQPS